MQSNLGKSLYGIIKKKTCLKVLSEKLEISRATLYNKFISGKFSFEFVIKIANIINYDFYREIPELSKYAKKKKLKLYFNNEYKKSTSTKVKYMKLHKKYHMLLEFLIHLSETYNLEKLKKQINQMKKITKI